MRRFGGILTEARRAKIKEGDIWRAWVVTIYLMLQK
jgi:hypothetical protein